MLLAIEFVSDRDSKLPFPAGRGVTSLIVDKAFGKGLLLYPAAGGVDGAGDAVIVAPPLVITVEEIDVLARILEETIREAALEIRQTERRNADEQDQNLG